MISGAQAKQQFVDREDVLSRLEGSFEAVSASGDGRVALITGEPGIGKSAVVNELLGRLRKNEATVLCATGAATNVGAYSSLGGILEPLLQSSNIVQEGKQVAQVVLNLARVVPSVGVYADAASSIAKGLRNLSGHDIQSISMSLYVKTLLVTLIERLARRRPVVVFADDIQWFDEYSLEAIGFLLPNLVGVGALVLLSCRSGYPMNQGEGRNLLAVEDMVGKLGDSAVHLRLDSLAAKPSEELCRRMLGGSKVSQETLSSLVARSGGNPLLITKTLRELVEQKLVTNGRSGWQLSGDPSTVIPASFSSLVKRVLLRIQKENPVARTALDYGAILGKRFDTWTLASLANQDVLATKHVLEEVESVYGLIRPTELPTEYVFDHDLTRETILSSLGELARPYHLKVARLLDTSGKTSGKPQLTAYHYEQAGEYVRAFDLYRTAAKGTGAKMAFAEQASYLDACLRIYTGHGIPLSKPKASELYLASSLALFSNGRFESAFANAQKSLEAGALPLRGRAEAHLLAGKSCRYLGTPEAGRTGISHLQESVSLFEKTNDQTRAGEALSSLATIADHFGDQKLCAESFGRSQKAFNLARDPTGLAILGRKSGMIYDARRVVGFIRSALEVFEKTDSYLEIARCYNNLGGEYFYLGDLSESRASLLRALELYRRFEFYEVDAALNNLGLVQMQLGELSQARDSLEEAERRACEDFNAICIGSNLGMLYRVARTGEDALSKLSSLVPLVLRSGEPMIQDYFAFNMASLLYDAGRYEQALEWLERFSPNTWKRDDSLVMAKRMRARARILSKLGRESEAAETGSRADALFKTGRPQRWFYELDFYPCDVHILD